MLSELQLTVEPSDSPALLLFHLDVAIQRKHPQTSNGVDNKGSDGICFLSSKLRSAFAQLFIALIMTRIG